MSNELALRTDQELNKWEEQVHKGADMLCGGAWLIGEALLHIRDQGIYRTYSTFELYCKATFDLSKSRAYQLIGAWEVRQLMSTRVDKAPQLQTEKQARELRKLRDEPGKMAQAWAKASANKTPEEITAADVRREVKALLPEKPKTVERDVAAEQEQLRTELPLEPLLPKDLEIDVAKILPKVAKVLRDRVRSEDLIRAIMATRRKLRALQSDPIMLYTSIQNIDLTLKQAVRMLRLHLPWSPCGNCNQRGCEECRPSGTKRGVGWLDRFEYEKVLHADLKKLKPKLK